MKRLAFSVWRQAIAPHSFNEWDAANAELKALGVVP